MKKVAFILVILMCFKTIHAQTDTVASKKVCLQSNEIELYKLLMEYRQQNGLPTIPLSSSLSFVAQTHCKDLDANYVKSSLCNMHSWSNKGKWIGCCYSPDHANASLMWSKPRELTKYKGNGYEIAFYSWHSDGNHIAEPEEALDGWKNSQGHNEVILNKGIWQTSTWKAIGIGIYHGYAMVWFGEEVDTEPTPSICSQ